MFITRLHSYISWHNLLSFFFMTKPLLSFLISVFINIILNAHTRFLKQNGLFIYLQQIINVQSLVSQFLPLGKCGES